MRNPNKIHIFARLLVKIGVFQVILDLGNNCLSARSAAPRDDIFWSLAVGQSLKMCVYGVLIIYIFVRTFFQQCSAHWAFYCTRLHKKYKHLRNGYLLQSRTKKALVQIQFAKYWHISGCYAPVSLIKDSCSRPWLTRYTEKNIFLL